MEPSILQKKAEILLERDVYPLLKNFPQAEKFSLSQEIKQSCFRLIRAAVMANNLTVVKKRLEWLDEADAEKTLLVGINPRHRCQAVSAKERMPR